MRDRSYKQPGQTIVTVPVDPELHRRLRVRCAEDGTTIKAFVTQAIARALEGYYDSFEI